EREARVHACGWNAEARGPLEAAGIRGRRIRGAFRARRAGPCAALHHRTGPRHRGVDAAARRGRPVPLGPRAMPKHVLIVGAGVVGLSTAWHAAQRGHQVTVLDKEDAASAGCSFGNAGIVCPSHFVPLAAPGMVALGLRYMWDPESPFYVKPRLDPE